MKLQMWAVVDPTNKILSGTIAETHVMSLEKFNKHQTGKLAIWQTWVDRGYSTKPVYVSTAEEQIKAVTPPKEYQILIVPPNMLKDKCEELKEAGFICIGTDNPAAVQLVKPGTLTLSNNELAAAAFKAIAVHRDVATCRQLSTELADMYKSNI